MSPSQIDDVDVITNAGAVARRVVVTINVYVLALSGRNLQNDRNKMCFRIVPFTTSLSRTGCVEIAQ